MLLFLKTARESIQAFLGKNKVVRPVFMRDTMLCVTVICVSVLSFGVAKIGQEREVACPLSIEDARARFASKTGEDATSTMGEIEPKVSAESVLEPPRGSKNRASPLGAGGQVVGSKNGDRYHYPWCPGADQIKEENKVWFASEAAAIEAGYTKAKNCQ
jgi:hypothetical protein